MNIEGMLPFENMIADYVKETGNHVIYRVTPIFKGNNLLASGVHLEGLSVEDNGEGICFNVYVYNVQPGIILDYATGANQLGKVPVSTEGDVSDDDNNGGDAIYAYVINKNTGVIHLPECASAKSMKPENKLESNDTLDHLLNEGYKVCGNCNPT
jgi:DNA-entry nuclease